MIALEKHEGISQSMSMYALQRCRLALRNSRIEPWRSLSRWATEEVVIPTGPMAGRKFRFDYQPWVKLLYEEIDKEIWWEIASVGPSQSGKTFSCFAMPMCWYLFERCEDVIAFAPTEDICREKWERDLKPLIQRTRYAHLLPVEGGGGRGGFTSFMRFGNGARLKWMTAGGDDKSRAHYTSRVIFMTEVDGMADMSSTSAEADKIKQVEARGNAYASRKVVFKECTASIEQGHIWQRYNAGTKSKIVTPCPHCKRGVVLERDDFSGWKECETDVLAKENAGFFCSSCGEKWNDRDRRKANNDALLLHDGQCLDENGKVTGDAKQTLTLGFRWSAVNNLLEESGNLGVQEWNAEREVNRENAERKMHQFVWALPYDDPNVQITAIDPKKIQNRQGEWTRGYVPSGAKWITVGCDVQKRLLYWTVMANWDDGRRHILDYGRTEVATDDLGIDVALPSALRELREMCDRGWTSEDGAAIQPCEIWIDAGNWSNLIFGFILDPETDCGRYRPTFGRGFGQHKGQHRAFYSKPKKTTATIVLLGDEYHISRRQDQPIFPVEINVDYYKTRLHMSLQTTNTTHKTTLFKAIPSDHTSFCSHLAAEHRVEKFVAHRGNVTVWEAHSRNNHFLDSTTLAYAASAFCHEYRSENQNVQSQSEQLPEQQGQPSINLRRAIGQ